MHNDESLTLMITLSTWKTRRPIKGRRVFFPLLLFYKREQKVKNPNFLFGAARQSKSKLCFWGSKIKQKSRELEIIHRRKNKGGFCQEWRICFINHKPQPWKASGVWRPWERCSGAAQGAQYLSPCSKTQARCLTSSGLFITHPVMQNPYLNAHWSMSAQLCRARGTDV